MTYRSGTTYSAFAEFDCDECLGPIWEGDEFGYVNGEKVCEPCWDAVDLDNEWDL